METHKNQLQNTLLAHIKNPTSAFQLWVPTSRSVTNLVRWPVCCVFLQIRPPAPPVALVAVAYGRSNWVWRKAHIGPRVRWFNYCQAPAEGRPLKTSQSPPVVPGRSPGEFVRREALADHAIARGRLDGRVPPDDHGSPMPPRAAHLCRTPCPSTRCTV